MKNVNITQSGYKKALLKKGVIRKGDIEILNFLYNQPDHQASVVEIGETLNKKHIIEINGAFGRLGNRVKIEIGTPQLQNFNGWYILATGFEDGPYFIWQLRPNLVLALEQLSLVKKEIPEIKISENDLFEGIRRRVMLNVYERNKEAREKCLKFHEPTCLICGFNGERKYGSLGKNIIHVHHIIPLSKIGGHYKVDPINDLKPLCPNCHSLIHKKEPPYSIDELKSIIKKKG